MIVMSGAHKKAKAAGITLLDPKIVQNFLFLYIDARMKTDKFTLLVGKAVESFLLSLEKPLQLNEMRVMKDANYTRFRQILSDTHLFGDEILALMKENCKELGLSRKAFEFVYEGFWDLYCKKPVNPTEIPTKRLEGFLQRVQLKVPPLDGGDDDGSAQQTARKLPLKAIARIRIPLNRPPPVIEQMADDNDDDQDKQNDTARSPGLASAREHQQLSTHPDEDQSAFTEQIIEDRVLMVNPISEGHRIWIMHQAATRMLRKDMATVFKKSLKELDGIELEEFLSSVEAHAVEIEKNFIKMFSSEETNEFDAIRAKYLGFAGPIPTFDFELN